MIRRAQREFLKARQKAKREGALELQQTDYIQVFAITMANINKALAKLDKKNPTVEDAKVNIKLPKELRDLYKHFLNNEGTSLPLY